MLAPRMLILQSVFLTQLRGVTRVTRCFSEAVWQNVSHPESYFYNCFFSHGFGGDTCHPLLF